jgi:hypothetical protein
MSGKRCGGGCGIQEGTVGHWGRVRWSRPHAAGGRAGLSTGATDRAQVRSRAGGHGGVTWRPRLEGAATGGGARRSVEERGGQ